MPGLIIKRKGKEIRRRTFSKDIVTIGRATETNIHLPDEKVSRYQAALIKLRSGYFIRDLGSLLSTKVNGKIVYRKLLEDKDIIEIGDFILEYHKESPEDESDDWFEIISDDTERKFQRGDESQTKYYELVNSQFIPKLSQEKRTILLDLIKQIKAFSPFSEILKSVLDSIFEAFRLKKIGIIINDGENLKFSASKGIDVKGGEKVAIPPSLIDDLAGKEYIREKKSFKETLITPLRARGREITGFIYLEKGVSEGGFLPEDVDFLIAIAHRLCEKISSKKKTGEIASEEIFDWPSLIIGNSKKMDEIRNKIKEISPSDGTVLILGETGTGKELVAREIHENSPRKDNPFIIVNCTTLSKELVESSLFGHEKGAFTGAITQKKGLVEEADKGTLFLDEIGELSLDIQPKFLRFLQTKEFERVGGTETKKVDVRIVAATNKNLDEAVEKKEFRKDLFQRLKTFVISLPPLRERREDIPLLAHFFLDKFAKESSKNIKSISHGAMNLLWERYDWLGNVRELEQCLKGTVVVMPEGRTIISLHDLPEKIKEIKRKFEPKETKGERCKSLRELEKEEIEKVLNTTKGNKKRAAEVLEISRPTLDKKIKKYGISIVKCKEGCKEILHLRSPCSDDVRRKSH